MFYYEIYKSMNCYYTSTRLWSVYVIFFYFLQLKLWWLGIFMFFSLYLTTLVVYKCFWSMGKRLGTNGTSEVAYSIQYFIPAKAKTWPFPLAPSNNPMHNLVTFPISFLIRLYNVWFWLTDRKEGEKYIFYYFLFVFISFFVSHLTKR